jgi:hypothetical protein
MEKEVAKHPALPAVAIWSIWLERNKVTFEDKQPSPLRVLYRIKHFYFDLPKASIKRTPRQVTELNIDKSIPWGSFDGTSKGNPGACGAGGAIHV